MDLTVYPAADGDILLWKIGMMCRQSVKSVDGSRVRIARSGQLMDESNKRTNARAVRVSIRVADMDRELIPDWIKRPRSLLARVHQTRASSEVRLRRTREIIARSRALIIKAVRGGPTRE